MIINANFCVVLNTRWPVGAYSSPSQLYVSLIGSKQRLFGYDQGVISGVITMESFGARFPRVFTDSGFKRLVCVDAATR
jgi:hypothetical protein